jgi:hypothetical protein
MDFIRNLFNSCLQSLFICLIWLAILVFNLLFAVYSFIAQIKIGQKSQTKTLTEIETNF